MTQPLYPALLPQQRPPLLPSLPQPGAPVPGAPAPPAAPSLREQAAAIDAQRDRLEADHGALETAANQFARGALDALLAPGALAASLAEGAGEATGWEGLRDFGRDLGRSAQGDQAMAVLSAVPDARDYAWRRLAGASPEEAIAANRPAAAESLRSYEQSIQSIREEEEAWPMLSATSRLAGSVAFGVAVGSAAGHVGLAQQAGLAAFEGSGYGAQSAYAKDAPLRDVATSALVSGVLGAGLTAGVGKGLPYLRRQMSGSLRELASESALNAAGFKGSDFRRAVRELRGEAAAARIDDLGQELLDYTLRSGPNAGKKILRFGRKAEDMAGDLGAAVKELGEDIGLVRSTIDKAMKDQPDLAPDMGSFFQRVDDEVLRPLRASDSPAMHAKADKIERSLEKLREAYDVRDIALRGEPARVRTREGLIEMRPRKDPGPPRTFEQLDKFRRDLADEIYPKSPPGGGIPSPAPDHAFELLKVERMLADHLHDAADNALGRMGIDQGSYRRLHRVYSNFRDLSEVATKAQLQDLGNRAVSLTDYMTGLSFGNLAGVPAGIATALGHKVLRERGRSALAIVANMLAGHGDDARHLVSVSHAGGREAQEAISTIERARRFVRDVGEAAGPNPAMQQAARQVAKEDVEQVLTQQAGKFDANWTKRPPTTLQKVLYRGPILDQVATDTAAAVQKVAALRPSLAAPLDGKRLGKLLANADGPAAIGGVQMRVGKLLEQLPVGQEAQALAGGLRAVSQRLQATGTAETMQTAHELVLRLQQAAQAAQDPAVRAYAQRASAELAQELSAPAWGRAGELYGKLQGAAAEPLAALADPKVMRDALRMVELRGKLSGVARDGAAQIRSAQEALEELTGTAPQGADDLKALERLFEQAEEAVTLDGGPVNRVLDWFASKLDERVSGSLGAHVQRGLGDQPGHVAETAVAHAVKGRLAKVAKVLHTAQHGAEHTGIHLAQSGAIGAVQSGEGKAAGKAARPFASASTRLLTPQEKQQQYANRIELLSEVTKGDADLDDGLAAVRAIAPGLDAVAAQDFYEKLAVLDAELPRPQRSGIRGPSTLSQQDIRKASAMWEATVDPLSVFDDFAAGNVDMEKVQFAWRLYPGLKLAAQMGLQDVLFHQMGDEQRDAIPEHVLTALDGLFGSDGGIQPTVAPDFVAAIDQLAAEHAKQAQQQGARNKPLDLPTSKLTPVQRIAGQRR